MVVGFLFGHLAAVLLEGGDGQVDVIRDVDVLVGVVGFHDPDFPDLVRLQPFLQKLGEGQVVAGGWEDGREGGFTGGEVVGVAQVAVAGKLAGGPHADKHVGAEAAYLPGQVPPQGQGRFQHGVLVVEEDHVGQPEHLAGVELLLSAQGHQLGAGQLAVVAALAAVGAEDVHDLPALGAPLGDGAGASPLGVVGVGHDDHAATSVTPPGMLGVVSLAGPRWGWFLAGH